MPSQREKEKIKQHWKETYEPWTNLDKEPENIFLLYHAQSEKHMDQHADSEEYAGGDVILNEPVKVSRKKFLPGALAKWRRRSRTERRLLLEAFLLLGMARMGLLILPFRWLARSLGQHMQEDQTPLHSSDLKLARMIGGTVRTAANHTLWKSACLPQAVAAKWMLKRRHIPGTVYMGVMKDETNPEKLAAHAWIRCGDIILTGARGHHQYTVVSTFS